MDRTGNTRQARQGEGQDTEQRQTTTADRDNTQTQTEERAELADWLVCMYEILWLGGYFVCVAGGGRIVPGFTTKPEAAPTGAGDSPPPAIFSG
jgi:hypothetical protein